MALLDAPDDAQTSSEGDGQDTSEPPSSDRKASIVTPSYSEAPRHNGSIAPMSLVLPASQPKDSQPRPLANGHANSTGRGSSISRSSPHHESHLQESGHSHRDLQPLVVPRPAIQVQNSHSTTTSPSPSPTSSPSPSESNPWSAPPTLPPSMPPSQAPSRAASMSGTKPDLSSLLPSPGPPAKGSKKDHHAPATPVEPGPAPRNKGPSSIHSSEGGKFNLKDLLGSAPKLSRKSSARSSASSRKSDSEGGPRSTGGESTGLLKKYGTCERVAIGKGATSVVRLAHKWDRTEEKLYAVKVILFLDSPWFLLILRRLAGVQKATQE